MDPALLVKTAAVLLVLTGLGGIVMALMRFKVDRPPNWLAMAHGFLAAAALTLLLYAAAVVGLPRLMLFGVLLLLVVGGLGVVLNLAYQTQLKPLPVLLVLVHGLLAVVALLIVGLGAFETPLALPAG